MKDYVAKIDGGDEEDATIEKECELKGGFKKMKTLIFEGAGWADADTSKATDVTNCRIRTRLRNNSGRVIYLEILCCHFENPKTTPEWAKGMNYTAYIDSVFYSDSKWDNNRNFSRDLQPLTNIHFEYNKDNILKFVNEKLNCSFDNIVIYNNGEVRVHNSEEPLYTHNLVIV